MNLSKEEIAETLKRYHFSKEDLPALCSFFQALKPLVEGKAFYEVINGREEKPELFEFVEEEQFLAAIVTIGSGVDRLKELYLEAEDVSAAYMVDCLSLTLLNKAYEQLAEQIAKEEGLYISQYEFLGGKYPLERVQDMFRYFSQTEVSYNAAYVLIPQKSVAYFAKLTKEKTERCRNICADCENKACANRIEEYIRYAKSEEWKQEDTSEEAKTREIENGKLLPYGYQRILGKEKS